MHFFMIYAVVKTREAFTFFFFLITPGFRSAYQYPKTQRMAYI